MAKKKRAFTVYYNEETEEVEGIELSKRFAEEGTFFRVEIFQQAMMAIDEISEIERRELFLSFDDAGEA